MHMPFTPTREATGGSNVTNIHYYLIKSLIPFQFGSVFIFIVDDGYDLLIHKPIPGVPCKEMPQHEARLRPKVKLRPRYNPV